MRRPHWVPAARVAAPSGRAAAPAGTGPRRARGADVVLSAEQHFETLREAVWVRFCARHRTSDRERFDDLYAEWWAREAERAAKGSPSRAAAPAAFIAEAVHHVLIDDARARARGLGRDAKASLELVDIDRQRAAAAADDTATTAAYEALVHRVLTLVRDHLSDRETRVFVWSFLYLQPSAVTAEALGLSLPRVKKDRRRIAAKVGREVWAVLARELDLCAAYDEKSLPAIFEVLTVHVEDCSVCAHALGGLRRGALVVIGPELLAIETSTHLVSDAMASLAARTHGVLHRGAETLIALPPSGRTAAAVAVAATAVAGGAATVVPTREQPQRTQRQQVHERGAPPAPSVTRAPAAARRVPARGPARPRRRPPAPTPGAVVAQAPAREPITFEQQPPARRTSTARTAAAPRSSPSTATKEFGFEHR